MVAVFAVILAVFDDTLFDNANSVDLAVVFSFASAVSRFVRSIVLAFKDKPEITSVEFAFKLILLDKNVVSIVTPPPPREKL